MAGGIKKIWGSSYTPKKLYYTTGQYGRQLNRSAYDAMRSTQLNAIQNIFAAGSDYTYSSVALTLQSVQSLASEGLKAQSQAQVADLQQQVSEQGIDLTA